MKKIFLFISLIWLIACNDSPDKSAEEQISFRAILPNETLDSTVVNARGDTQYYYSKNNNVSIPYTYKTQRVEFRYKAGPGPIDTVPTPPIDPGSVTRTFNLDTIPVSQRDAYGAGRGAEQWHDGSAGVGIPGTPPDVYYRFVWTRIEGATEGSYNFTFFDNLVNAAISRKQKLSFGIMTDYPDGNTSLGLARYADGSFGSYPEYLHKAMQAEAVKDWKAGSTWVPNYNSTKYTDRLLALHKALNAHIYAKGYDKVIQYIDIRGYGCWGEWNSSGIVNDVNQYPAGTFPTVASLKRIVDTHRDGFPNFPLQAMIAGFDAQWLRNVWNPAEIAYYLLTQKNNWGLYGWRRDQWGAGDQYLKDYLENNNRSFNGLVFKTAIMDRWKFAPITGEPMPSGNPMNDLERQIRLYHATSFGNGNYGNVSGSTLNANVLAASKACGYRLYPTNGVVKTGTNGTITLLWTNGGIAPTYENWKVVYELKSGANVVWTGTSTFAPKLFLPGKQSHTDTFGSIPNGDYILTVKVIDPAGYRAPIGLELKNRATDGSYALTSIK